MSLLETLFAPRRVALVGASDRAGPLGQLLVRNLQEYAGEVVQVRSGGSLRDVEGHIDLAAVAVPAAAAPAVAAEAAAVGVSGLLPGRASSFASSGVARTRSLCGAVPAATRADLACSAGSSKCINSSSRRPRCSREGGGVERFSAVSWATAGARSDMNHTRSAAMDICSKTPAQAEP